MGVGRLHLLDYAGGDVDVCYAVVTRQVEVVLDRAVAAADVQDCALVVGLERLVQQGGK